MDPTQIPCRLRPSPAHVRDAHVREYRLDTEKHLHQGELPSHVDFRNTEFLPQVLDQGQLGSCVFNASEYPWPPCYRLSSSAARKRWVFLYVL